MSIIRVLQRVGQAESDCIAAGTTRIMSSSLVTPPFLIFSLFFHHVGTFLSFPLFSGSLACIKGQCHEIVDPFSLVKTPYLGQLHKNVNRQNQFCTVSVSQRKFETPESLGDRYFQLFFRAFNDYADTAYVC